MSENDHYRGLGYRRLFSWSDRLDREWPFLTDRLADAPRRSVVDLGCGPGEHLGRLHDEGWRAVGVDRSAAQIESARERFPDVRFVHGPMEDVADLTGERFGAALCLGNALPGLHDDALERLLSQLRACLLPGGVFVVQLLDYARILAGTRRAIGPIFRPPPEGAPSGDETVFLRLFSAGPREGTVSFTPMTLRLHADHTPPVELERAERIVQRAWTAEELEAALTRHGFDAVQRFGDLRGAAHDPETADDLVLVARHRPTARES